jgi:hypothetical protein
MRRRFTQEQANQTLPLVRRIVAEILQKGRELRASEGVERRGALEAQVHGLVGELEKIGCAYKDWGFEKGLVDFPAVIGGREVLLCWRSDEERVEWFHGVEEGFAGRVRIGDA